MRRNTTAPGNTPPGALRQGSDLDEQRRKAELLAEIINPPDFESRGRPRADDARMVDAIYYLLSNRLPWEKLPRDLFGPKTTVQGRFKEWEPIIRRVWPDLYNTYQHRQNRRNVK